MWPHLCIFKLKTKSYFKHLLKFWTILLFLKQITQITESLKDKYKILKCLFVKYSHHLIFIFLECGVQIDSTDEMLKFVHTANEAIAPFNLEIKKGIQEDDGANFYCLVCRPNFYKIFTRYSFKKIIVYIIPLMLISIIWKKSHRHILK